MGNPYHDFKETWVPISDGGDFPCKRSFMKLRRKFQKEFLDKALAPGIDIAALSLSRGNGKSFLAAHILTPVSNTWGRAESAGQRVCQCGG